MRDNVINEQTRNVVRTALGGYLSAELSPWAGDAFGATAPQQLEAIIGSPNGLAVGNMLVQHADRLGGIRRVVKAVVWRVKPMGLDWFQKHGPCMNMLFELSEASVQASGGKRPGSPGIDSRPGKKVAPQI